MPRRILITGVSPAPESPATTPRGGSVAPAAVAVVAWLGFPTLLAELVRRNHLARGR